MHDLNVYRKIVHGRRDINLELHSYKVQSKQPEIHKKKKKLTDLQFITKNLRIKKFIEPTLIHEFIIFLKNNYLLWSSKIKRKL